jgi:autotransporter-associated beta strand protein
VNGGAGGNGTSGGAGGGGGGGYNGNGTGAATITNTTPVVGGVGGHGGDGSGSAAGGGGGGSGGYGQVVTGSGTNSNTSNITGGKGGDGGTGFGAGVVGGTGGGGGGGLFLSTGSTFTNTSTGVITGGAGGAGGAASGGAAVGLAGSGGSGIVATGATIENAGTISGGLYGDGVTRGNAISFTGGTNVLTIDATSAIIGNVIAFSVADTLALGGSGSGSFDVSNIGGSAQYRGFGVFQMTGSGTWTLTNTTSAFTPWTVKSGVLSITQDGSLGLATGNVTLDGGTLQVAAATTITHAVTLTTTGGTIDVDGKSVIFSNVLSGTNGKLTVTSTGGPGTLILTGTNTYTGGTTINSGATLQLGQTGSNITTGSIVGAILDNGSLVNAVDNPASGGVTTTTLSGVISGTGTVTQAGPGILVLTGANTYGGGTTVTKGLINFANTGNLGTANVTLNGGGLQWASGNTTDISAKLNAIGASGGTFDTNGNNVSFAHAITGAGGITKTGSGILSLTVANPGFSGTTTVTGGFINFTQLSNFGSAPSITLNGGGLQWASGTTLDISSSLTAIGANGAKFDTNNNNPITLATALTGGSSSAAGLTKLGPGTLILANAETYIGGTVISAGTLQIGNGDTTSSIVGNTTYGVTDNGTLAFDRSDPVSYGGAITGSGNLTLVADSGALTLTNTINITGSTQLGTTGHGVNLTINAAGNSLLGSPTSVISGDGSLTQNGTAATSVLTVRGANTYTGGTFVTGGLINFVSSVNFGTAKITLNGGGLQWASGSVNSTFDISGDLNALGAGGATFDTNGNNVLFATVLSGAGGLTKAGNGVLTLSVDNTYTGGTTVTGGLLNFADIGDFGVPSGGQPSITLNGGGLQWRTGTSLDISSDLTAIGAGGAIFDTNNNAVTLGTQLTGTGGITKSGLGTLTLSVAEAYSGATIINGGTLSVLNSLTSSSGVTVNNAGTLAGTGTVSKVIVAQGGTISPGVGGGVGVLNVQGNSAFNGTISINAASGALNAQSEVVVNGTAAISGALNLNPAATFTAGDLGDHFTVLTSTALTGTFAQVTVSNTNFSSVNLIPIVSYTSTSAVVTLDAATISPFLPAHTGRNVQDVSHAIDIAMADDGAVTTFAPLSSLAPADLVATLSQFTGEVGPATQDTLVNTSSGFLDTLGNAASVGDPAGRARYSSRRGLMGLSDSDSDDFSGDGFTSLRHSARGLELWGELQGAHNNTDGNSALGTHGTDANNFGGIFGFGFHAPSGRLNAGLAAGYSSLDWSLSNGLGNGSATALQAGIYASTMIGDAYVSTAGTFAHYDVATHRTLIFPTATTNRYEGKFSADDVGGHIETGERFVTPVGWLTPYFDVAFQQLDTPSYGERTLTGSSQYALQYAKKGHSDISTEIGAAYDSAFGGDTPHLFSVHMRLGWLHDFSAGISDTATFSGFSGATFTVFGAQPPKDAAHATFGFEKDFGGLSLKLDLQGIVGENSQTIGGDGGIAYRW